MLEAVAAVRANAVSSVADGARRWLASGRVQSAGGGFCAWWDADRGAVAFEYPEITGYALSWLAAQPDLTDQELEAGHRAARWLCHRLSGGDRSARAGWDGGAVYTFDLGMVAAGLTSFGRRTGMAEYLKEASALAGALARLAGHPDGLPALDPDGPPTSRPPEWSTAGRAHLVKCVQALLLAGEDAAARRLCAQALAAEDGAGRFRTGPDGAQVMLHPLLYTVEGLWMAGAALREPAFVDAARRGTEWAWRHQLPAGGFPRWASATGCGPEQLDVTSQAVRAAVLLGADHPGIDAAVERLLGCARRDGQFGWAQIYQPQARAVHLNSWVTMFCAQALRVVGEGPDAVEWNTLV